MAYDFSIITVTFNSEKTIERTIKSVLKQTHNYFEYIIVDGGSTDQTNAIVEKFKSKFDNNIKHISEKDEGIYDAMNKGIELAEGKIIGLLNSDDFYFEDTLSNVFKSYIKSDRKSVITGNMIFKSNKGEQVLKNSEKRLQLKFKYFKNGVRHPATFVPKVIYNEIGLFNLNFKIASDAELMMRIFKANYGFILIDKPLMTMSDGGISNSKGIVRQIVLEKSYLLDLYCPNKYLKHFFITETKLRFKLKELATSLTNMYRKIENQ